MKKVGLFAVMAFMFLAITMQSCSVDENGELHLTWLFWFLLIGFIVLTAYTIVSSNKEQKETNEKLKSEGISNEDFKKTDATYVGGHPDADNNISNIVYRKNDDELLFYSRLADFKMPEYAFKIPITQIKDIGIEDATSMESKVTVGRLFLVGIFAFAWKKKKKDELAFVTIDWNDGRFDHTTILNLEGKDAMQRANTLRNQLIRDVK